MAAVAVFLWCGRARADSSVGDVPKESRPRVGFMAGFGPLLIAPALADSVFRGTGQPVGGGPAGFSHKGRDMGLQRPPLLAGQLRIGLVGRHFEIGGQLLFGAANVGRSDGGGSPTVRRLVNPRTVDMEGFGGHVLGVLPLGPVTLTFGPDIGFRSFTVPLVGFATYECQTRSGKSQCLHDATAAQLYVQPQAGVLFNTRPITKFGSGFFLHVWVGGDVLPAPAFVFGVTVGGAMDHNRMAP